MNEDELKKIAKEPSEEVKEVNILYDEKKQICTIRIPIAFARAVKIKNGDKFKFILSTEYNLEKRKVENNLKGELKSD